MPNNATQTDLTPDEAATDFYAVRWGRFNYFNEPCGKWHICDGNDKSGDYHPQTLCGVNIPLAFEGGNGMPDIGSSLGEVTCVRCLNSPRGRAALAAYETKEETYEI